MAIRNSQSLKVTLNPVITLVEIDSERLFDLVSTLNRNLIL